MSYLHLLIMIAVIRGSRIVRRLIRPQVALEPIDPLIAAYVSALSKGETDMALTCARLIVAGV